ncbi:TPA: Fe-S cluster assembly protein SufD [Klebsiella pneumoniae]|nr:Fe-S cluster assembly protein SufD [Klebsiella pneumoniae]
MAGLPNSSNALQQWHHLFEAQGGPRTPEASQHLQQLLRLGLPTRKHEDWKYTPLDALLNGRFVAVEGASLSAEQRDALALPLDAWRLVFIDGRYHPQLSDDLAASGVEVSVDNQRQHLPDALQPEVFLHLTESLAQTVTRIRVPRNRRLDKPLLLMHITSGLAGDALNTAHYRHHLALESGAEATIVEHYLSLNEQPHFTGGRLTMTVADNAHLQHIKLAFENARSYHFAHNDLLLGRDASAFSSSFLLGGQVLRHQTSTRLGGENSNLRLNSLAMPVKNEVCDSRTWLDHQVGYCTSRQLHKTIVSDKGRAVFNGLINVGAGDNIIISEMEHHANIVPWQMLCARVGAELRVIPLNPDGTLQLDVVPGLFDPRTRLLAITEVSNVLGTENPLAALIALAHQHGAKVLVDGAQAVMHHPVDVQALGCDFYVFSAHKLYGPTGIGVLYARSELLQTMAPWEGGGSMIATVSLTEGTTWNQAPWRFEAGTPNTGGIIGLGAALTYVSQLGLTQIAEYEQTLMRYALDALRAVPDLILYGPAQRKGVIAFNLGQHHAYDVGSFLDNYGIAVRTGHHCAMPLMARYQVPAMCRASLAMYNTTEEVDRLVAGLQRIRKLLG